MFDEDDLIGCSLPEAQDMAGGYGFSCRAASYNGCELSTTGDYDEDRVNVHLIDGIVNSVAGWG